MTQAQQRESFFDTVEEIARVDKTERTHYSIRLATRPDPTAEPYLIIQEMYNTRYDPTYRPGQQRLSFPYSILSDLVATLTAVTTH